MKISQLTINRINKIREKKTIKLKSRKDKNGTSGATSGVSNTIQNI